jgi:hypothetical protein
MIIISGDQKYFYNVIIIIFDLKIIRSVEEVSEIWAL